MDSRRVSDFVVTRCPVCAAPFGQRDKVTLFQAHCNECKATYWWYPWKDIPTVTMDSDVKITKKGCGCGCGR